MFAYIFLASFAANSAASADMLESFSSLRVVIESRAIALTICSGLNSKSISPGVQISVSLCLTFVSIEMLFYLGPKSPDLTSLVKYSSSDDDISDCIWIAVR